MSLKTRFLSRCRLPPLLGLRPLATAFLREATGMAASERRAPPSLIRAPSAVSVTVWGSSTGCSDATAPRPRARRGATSRRRRDRKNRPPPPATTRTSVKVAGESYRQDELVQITTGRRGSEAVKMDNVDLELVCEPDNPHDPAP